MKSTLVIRGLAAAVGFVCLLAACSDSSDPDDRDAGFVVGDVGDDRDAGDVVRPSGFFTRTWSFDRALRGQPALERIGEERGQTDGEVEDVEILGDLEALPPDRSPADAVSKLEVFGSDDGEALRVWSEAPPSASTTVGGVATLTQVQRLSRTGVGPSALLRLTGLSLEAFDGSPPPNDPADCIGQMLSQVELQVVAAAVTLDGEEIIYEGGGFVALDGCTDAWTDEAVSTGRADFWDISDFEVDKDVDDDGSWATIRLRSPLEVEIPLSELDVGQELLLSIRVRSTALPFRAEAYLAAGFEEDGGIEIELEGLTATAGVLVSNPDPFLEPGCPGGVTPEAGTLAFATAAADRTEGTGGRAAVLVTRLGGSTGEVSGVVRVSGGTAAVGEDFDLEGGVVAFGDGETGARAVMVPIYADGVVEADETIELVLERSGGCADIGAPAQTVLTILDVESRVEPDYALSGTVVGLEGAGLTLLDVLNGDVVRPSVDGPFVFPLRRATGFLYDVQIRDLPMNPLQTCTVTDGSGTFENADVTNVAVECETAALEGTLDPSFGSNGRVLTAVQGDARQLIVLPSGKLLAVATRSLLRFEANGAPDSTFGAAGVVDLDLGGASFEANGLAVQADGRAVVAGRVATANSDDFFVMRFETDGSLDPTFGTAGVVTTDFEGSVDRAYAVEVLAGGSILVAGHAAAPGPDNDFALARYTSAGVLDATFGVAGRVRTDIGGTGDFGFALVVQPDGKPVMVGRAATNGASTPDLGLVRYMADGALDTTFGPQSTGVVRHGWGAGNDATGVRVVLDPAGGILVGVRARVDGAFAMAVGRFSATGDVDLQFGDAGLASAMFPMSSLSVVSGLLLEPGGAIVAAGSATFAGGSDFALARFTTSGALDPTFGDGGLSTTDLAGDVDSGSAIAIDATGRYVVSGTARSGNTPRVALTRHLP